MNLLITGVCGFVGSTLARELMAAVEGCEIYGVDNLSRPGSEQNRQELQAAGVKFLHADLRCASDVARFPEVDWIIDAAANPSVLAGASGDGSSRQLMEHNLVGTLNVLERCRETKAGFLLLSTSRVYSIAPLAELAVESVDGAFQPCSPFPRGLTREGIDESFSTSPPVSLYGASKLASETLALEYGSTFDFPVWINRCGVLAGAGQFGKASQGIFSFWIHSHLRGAPLSYIGFGGEGYQVRDCLHPRDLIPLIRAQMNTLARDGAPRVVNVSGGIASARSLRQLTEWCNDRFGVREVCSAPVMRPFDLPWVVLDHRLVTEVWNWSPTIPVEAIWEEIARHAEANPTWLEISTRQ